MNSKALSVILICALGYAGFVWAHNKFDKRSKEVLPTAEDAFDASAYVGVLMREGLASIPRIRHDMNSSSESLDALLKAFPSPDEAWVDGFNELLLDKKPQDPQGPQISMPRGKQSAAPRQVQVRRPGVGSVWVFISRLRGDTKEEVVSFQAAVNVAAPIPADATFVAGESYEVRVSNHKDKGPYDRSVFQVIDEREKAELRSRMSTLKRHVHEVRARVFMQACVAMSMGLHNDAAGLLFERLPKQPGEIEEVGLIERLIFLSEHFRDRPHRDRMTKLLRSLR